MNGINCRKSIIKISHTSNCLINSILYFPEKLLDIFTKQAHRVVIRKILLQYLWQQQIYQAVYIQWW